MAASVTIYSRPTGGLGLVASLNPPCLGFIGRPHLSTSPTENSLFSLFFFAIWHLLCSPGDRSHRTTDVTVCMHAWAGTWRTGSQIRRGMNDLLYELRTLALGFIYFCFWDGWAGILSPQDKDGMFYDGDVHHIAVADISATRTQAGGLVKINKVVAR